MPDLVIAPGHDGFGRIGNTLVDFAQAGQIGLMAFDRRRRAVRQFPLHRCDEVTRQEHRREGGVQMWIYKPRHQYMFVEPFVDAVWMLIKPGRHRFQRSGFDDHAIATRNRSGCRH